MYRQTHIDIYTYRHIHIYIHIDTDRWTSKRRYRTLMLEGIVEPMALHLSALQISYDRQPA